MRKPLSPSGKKQLWLSVALLWIIWFIRAHNIMAMPIFVDESLHIIRAQVVYNFTDAKASILPAKLLLYYYLGLFSPQDVGGAWLSRQAVALLAPLSAALTVMLARMFFTRWRVVILTLMFYALLPFFIFFDRMAFADPFAMLFGISLAILSLRLAKSPSNKNAVYVGIMAGIAMLAKLTAAPWIVLPPIAACLFGGWKWPQYRQYGAIVAGIIVLMFVPSALYMTYQEFNPPENKVESVEQDLFTPAERERFDQINHNIATYAEAADRMFTTPWLVLLVGLGILQFIYQRKAALYLLFFAILIWLPITLTSARPSTRYLVAGVPGLLLLLTSGIDTLLYLAETQRDMAQKRLAQMGLGLVVIAFVAGAYQSILFIDNAWSSPEELALADRDIWEYYQNTAAGYPLRQVAHDLEKLPLLTDHPSGDEIPLAAFVGACHAMRLYFPADTNVGLHCPYYGWSPDTADQTRLEWQDRVQNDGVWYFLADAEQPMDVFGLDLHYEELAIYERPHDGIPVYLLRVSANDDSNP